MKLEPSYKDFLQEIKQKIYSTIFSVNRHMVELYFDMGRQIAGEITWGANIVIFTKCKDEIQREYYIKNTIEFGWNRNG